jgi:hypothetical protein
MMMNIEQEGLTEKLVCKMRRLETGKPISKNFQIIQLKKTPWHLVSERTISTERPPFVGEVSAKCWQSRFIDQNCSTAEI